MEFKVGDRVRRTSDWQTGEIMTPAAHRMWWVRFEKDGEFPVDEDDMELDPVTGTVDDLAEAVRKCAAYEPAVSAEEIGQIRSIGEQLGISTFEQNVRRILEGVADTVVQKNQAYGDSALNPIRVFSKTDRMEQLFVRLDDKLSRVQKGHEYPGDDTIRDIIGYCTLILIARESQ